MEEIKHFLNYTFAGVPLHQIGLALLCILGGFVLRWISVGVLRWILRHAHRTETQWDDIVLGALTRPLGWMCVILGLWVGVELLPIPTQPFDVRRLLHALLKAASEIIAVWFLLRLNDRAGRHAYEKALAAKSPAADFVPLARKTVRVFLLLVAILIIIHELGYSVTSLIAGLGLGGLAVGLAAKDTLANFFGSVVIFVDKPFAKGDWIKVGNEEGIVEEITVRVTRIRTFQDSLITIPNAQLTTSAITNFSRMRKRRVRFMLQVVYATPPEKIEAAVARIRELIAADERFLRDEIIVALHECGPYSLNILVNCYTTSTSYAGWLQAQQEIMLAVLKTLKELGIELAYPTQTIVVPGRDD